MKIEKAFYVPSATTIQDIAVQVDGVWIGGYGKKTIEEMRIENPTIELVDWNDELFKRLDDAQRARYVKPPSRITEKQFNDALEVLPPCKWMRMTYAESFHVSERLSGDLVDWYVRIGQESVDPKYYHLTESCRLSHSDVVAIVEGKKS